MIGGIRFSLASLVVLNHLWLPTANKLGAHAVTAFYIISGYLMSKVIQEVYGLSVSGGGRFLGNRFLRIFPPYLFFLAISLVLLLVFPNTFGQTYSDMKFPESVGSLLANITLINLPYTPEVVIPPAWTLSIEFFFYIAMVLLLARSRMIAVVWLIASLLVTIWLVAIGAKFAYRYTPTYAASLFFSTGAMVYFFRGRLARLTMDVRVAVVLFSLFCFFPLIVEAAGFDRTTVGFYVPALIFVPIFITFLGANNKTWRPADRMLGDLAYPVFISHFLAAGIIRIVFSNLITPYGLVFLLVSYFLCIGISLAFLHMNERWIDPIRDRVRAGRWRKQSNSFEHTVGAMKPARWRRPELLR